MGRLKALPTLNPLFSGKYKKLLDDCDTKDYAKLLQEENAQNVLAYSCHNCGHAQSLQVSSQPTAIWCAFFLFRRHPKRNI